MRLNVIKNTKRNLLFGIANKLVVILCPFVTKTIIQITLGAEYLGLNSLFTSVISVLNLTELGFGTAVVYNMYKPIAENDTETVCALLDFYKKVYRGIGIAVLMVGMILIPFLPHLINGSYPEELNLTLLYLIYLINTSISYFMYAYLSALIVVYQRDDINSITNISMILLQNGLQIAILFGFSNYYLFTLMMPVFTVANNLRIAYMARRMFPQYHCRGVLSSDLIQDINLRVKGAFLSKLCIASRNAFDSICISMYMGLTVTAIYNNYYYIMRAIIVLLSVVSSSIMGGVGNHVVIKSIEENFEELKKLDFLYMWVSGWCTICLLCLYQPFMKLWMGDEMMFPMPVIVLFCLYFYLLKTGDMRYIYSEVNGLWWQGRYQTMTEAILNLVLNFILGKFWGIYGIMIATIITIFICNFVWGLRIVFKYYFQLSRLKKYYQYQIKYAFITLVLCVLVYSICMLIPSGHTFFIFFLRMIVCLIVPNIFYILIYRNSEIFCQVKNMVKGYIKRKSK